MTLLLLLSYKFGPIQLKHAFGAGSVRTCWFFVFDLFSLGSLLWHKFQIQFSYTMHENNHLIRVTTHEPEIFGTNKCLASSRHSHENENVHLRLWFSTTLPPPIQMYWQYKRRQCSMLVVTPNNWNLNMISTIPMRTRTQHDVYISSLWICMCVWISVHDAYQIAVEKVLRN